MQDLSCENELDLHENKRHFYINDFAGFAVGFALKQRFRATGKWPRKFEPPYCLRTDLRTV